MNTKRLERYGQLIAREGVNVQPGQICLIMASIEDRVTAHGIAEQLKAAGASEVMFYWQDTEAEADRMRRENVAELAEAIPGFHEQCLRIVREGGIPIKITHYPEYPADIPPEKIEAFNKGVAAAKLPVTLAVMGMELQRCSVMAPNPGLAKIAFPELPTAAAVQAYEDMLARVCHLDEDNPGACLREQDKHCASKAAILGRMPIRKLHIVGPGTDLWVTMGVGSRWLAGYKATTKGVMTCANIPIGEVFSAPDCRHTHGTWQAPAPAIVNGVLVEDHRFVFENGEIVDWDAKTDAARRALELLITSEDAVEGIKRRGMRRLGEIAIVDRTQPISEFRHLVLADILPVEKSRPHAALGLPYLPCFPDAERLATLSKEEQRDEAGVNSSSRHFDFMVPDNLIEAELKDGSTVPVLEDGFFKI